jgi:hypothetical protein
LAETAFEVNWSNVQCRGGEIRLEIGEALFIVQIIETRNHGECTSHHQPCDEYGETKAMGRPSDSRQSDLLVPPACQLLRLH